MPRQERRVVEAASEGRIATYAEIIDGIPIHRPGKPPIIVRVGEKWNLAVQGPLWEILRDISRASFTRHGFLLTAIVVGKVSKRPGPGFFRLAIELGIRTEEDDPTAMWASQVAAVHRHYGR